MVVKSGTTLGEGNTIFEGAVLGGFPQHVRMPERLGRVEIGAHNTIRENCTVHRALHEGTLTRVGSNNLLMVGVHVAHDCTVGDNAIFANNALLGGFVTVGDRAFVSGAVGVHQFCRIGRLAMIGGCARVVQDVPPYVLVDGHSGLIVGLNLVGLRRNGYSAEEISQLKAAYRMIYRSGLRWVEILEQLKRIHHRPGGRVSRLPFAGHAWLRAGTAHAAGRHAETAPRRRRRAGRPPDQQGGLRANRLVAATHACRPSQRGKVFSQQSTAIFAALLYLFVIRCNAGEIGVDRGFVRVLDEEEQHVLGNVANRMQVVAREASHATPRVYSARATRASKRARAVGGATRTSE